MTYLFKIIKITTFVLSEIAVAILYRRMSQALELCPSIRLLCNHSGRTTFRDVLFFRHSRLRSGIQVALSSICLLMTCSEVKADIASVLLPEYRAHEAYEKKDFTAAQSGYEELIEQDPYNAEHNYNMGTVLYKQNKFEDAKSYFDRSVHATDVDHELKEQACFNQGNSHMQLQQYQDAIDAYEKVLEFNSDNERARKNLEIAKRLLEEQKQKQQEQEQKNNQDQKDDQQQDQQQKDSQDQKSDDQRSNDQKNDEQSNQQKEQDKKDSESQQNDKNKQDESGDQQQSKNNKQKSDQNQDKQDQSDQKKEEQRDDTQQQQQQSNIDQDKADQLKKQEEKEQQDDKGKQQDQSLQKSKEEEQKQASKSEQGDEQENEQEGSQLQDQYAAQMDADSTNDDRLNQKDSHLMRLLSDQEDSIQKQLLRLNVSKQGIQKDGQKNW